MLCLSYESWVKACEMVQSMGRNVQKMYFQMYPFSLIENWEEISTECFFEKYIKSGLFLELESTYFHPARFIQKGDGSLRRTSLVSPLNYLILLSLGCEVENSYKSVQKSNASHAAIYCSASFGLDSTEQYKKSYDEYRTSLNLGHDSFPYYLKIDITNYYNSIDVNRLFKLIEDEEILDARSSLLLSTFIKMIGNGNFPIVDGHGGLSYLATNVYLDEIDAATQNWINLRSECKDYHLVRYVDDLYIFFNISSEEDAELFATNLLEYIHDLYIRFGLSLNESKQIRFERTSDVPVEVSNGFYDFFVNGINLDYASYYSQIDLLEFFRRINEMPKHASSDDFDYALNAFKKEDLELSRSDILNSFIYNNKNAFEDEGIIMQLSSILLRNPRFLKLSVKQLVVSVLNTGSGDLIRRMLSRIFENYRNGQQTKYDELIIMEYLIQRGFKHIDLIHMMSCSSPEICRYIKDYCSNQSMITILQNEVEANLIHDANGNSGVYENDSRLHFMMLMFKFNSQQDNLMVAHSFLKSFFDRYAAIVESLLGESDKKNGKPDYKKYYKEGAHKVLLNSCNLKGGEIISELSKLRNRNPINHGSAESLGERQIYKSKYQQNIADIFQLIERYREYLSQK